MDSRQFQHPVVSIMVKQPYLFLVNTSKGLPSSSSSMKLYDSEYQAVLVMPVHVLFSCNWYGTNQFKKIGKNAPTAVLKVLETSLKPVHLP